jgi:hypothetical protein
MRMIRNDCSVSPESIQQAYSRIGKGKDITRAVCVKKFAQEIRAL